MILSDEDFILWRHKYGTFHDEPDVVTHLDPDAHIVEHLWKLRYRGYVNTWGNKILARNKVVISAARIYCTWLHGDYHPRLQTSMRFFVRWMKQIRHSNEFKLTDLREQDALTRANLGFIL